MWDQFDIQIREICSIEYLFTSSISFSPIRWSLVSPYRKLIDHMYTWMLLHILESRTWTCKNNGRTQTVQHLVSADAPTTRSEKAKRNKSTFTPSYAANCLFPKACAQISPNFKKVSGGPGSGKGTQCPKIVEHFGFTHLCAGDLLQAEIESESENGLALSIFNFYHITMIQNFKKEGKIVPSEITVKLLQQAMQQSDSKRFIIDGFPRNEENRAAFENIVKIKPEFVLFFDCPEEELTKRILNRNQGRVDDNIETIGKRLKVYFESTLPVINYYNSKGKVQKIDAQRSVDEVFEDVKSVFAKFKPVAGVGSTK
ncbi:hypothetical protein SADUNF_Sadunf14G0075800 [Salix dunnii]|uniref:adenylate kinase n=1 Tax=Salix dunnii TaxID=1413687 RepID=A0A835MTL1_9ROSI|nr:hypothetical protein SADUNF_Sadunf14G0075800 [Salix dunnii]